MEEQQGGAPSSCDTMFFSSSWTSNSVNCCYMSWQTTCFLLHSPLFETNEKQKLYRMFSVIFYHGQKLGPFINCGQINVSN